MSQFIAANYDNVMSIALSALAFALYFIGKRRGYWQGYREGKAYRSYRRSSHD